MQTKRKIPNFFIIVVALIVAVLCAVSVRAYTGYYGPAIIFLLVLFFILWYAASRREWMLPSRLLFIRSEKLSEIFLGLFLFVASGAIAWSLAIVISRACSDIEGILVGLVIFGFLEMIVAGSREWQ